jgi:cysteinyl-tRNA synthetase
MSLFVYNTLSRSKEEFKPISDKKVNMFVCGQTVYDDAHLGHASSYIFFDVVARWLRHLGYEVKYVQNITDIDDKIIKRAGESGKDPVEVARYYESRFLEDMDALGVKRGVNEYLRSHDYIDAIRSHIQLLIDKGYAYAIGDDIYYDVSKFKDYTKLSGVKLDELGKHRIEPNPDKRNVYDFSLWKAAKAGEPAWPIKLKMDGKEREFSGRPAWHIEDTAMTNAVFGPQYDLHGGGSDLIFPHHTNEIAQAEAAFGKKPFVKYWMHVEVLNMKGVKMSKSLKNFITIRETLKSHSPEALRLFILSAHYRKSRDYNERVIGEAEKTLSYMYIALGVFYGMKIGASDDEKEVTDAISDLRRDFSGAMNDDFDTPLALSTLMRTVNRLRNFAESHAAVSAATKDMALKAVLDLSSTLGVLEKDAYKESIGEDARALIKKREDLRKQGKFSDADGIRTELKEKHGIILEDTEYGTVWYRSG